MLERLRRYRELDRLIDRVLGEHYNARVVANTPGLFVVEARRIADSHPVLRVIASTPEDALARFASELHKPEWARQPVSGTLIVDDRRAPDSRLSA